jgi:hypothetical protein
MEGRGCCYWLPARSLELFFILFYFILFFFILLLYVSFYCNSAFRSGVYELLCAGYS